MKKIAENRDVPDTFSDLSQEFCTVSWKLFLRWKKSRLTVQLQEAQDQYVRLSPPKSLPLILLAPLSCTVLAIPLPGLLREILKFCQRVIFVASWLCA
jgi:hypothetical protein